MKLDPTVVMFVLYMLGSTDFFVGSAIGLWLHCQKTENPCQAISFPK